MRTSYILIFAIMTSIFASCSISNGVDNNYSPSAFVFKASVKDTGSSGVVFKGVQITEKDTFLIFSGKDIAWFNETTYELKFNDNFSGIDIVGNSEIAINAYSGDEFLYSMSFVLTNDLVSQQISFPVIFKENSERGYFLKKGYPDWDLTMYDKDHHIRKEREKNWNALVQSEGWKLFIEQLKEEGRYRN